MRTADTMTRARVPLWNELEFLVQKAGVSPDRMSAVEIDRLGHLYRAVVTDLAVARRDFPEDRVTTYLQQLTTRAHPVLFRGRRSAIVDFGRLLVVDFPRAVRSMGPENAISAVALFGTFFLVLGLTLWSPEVFRPHMPGGLMSRIDDVAAAVREHGASSWVDIPEGSRPVEGYLIAANNIQVTLLAFAGGALLGLFTLHVLVVNGVLLGLVTGFCILKGAAVPLGDFVAAHGFVELSVIVLAGAAGLSLGRAWLLPGDRPRLESVADAARRAVTVAIGGAVLLLVAGAIEGLLSPSAAPTWIKLTVGIATGTATWAFLALSGRTEAGAAPAEAGGERPRPATTQRRLRAFRSR